MLHRFPILVLSFCLSLALGAAAQSPATESPDARACCVIRKTLAGALEMYKLDHNTKVSELTIPLIQQLWKEGYLREVPADPGQGPGTTKNYYLGGGEPGVACRVHGAEPCRTKSAPPPAQTADDQEMLLLEAKAKVEMIADKYLPKAKACCERKPSETCTTSLAAAEADLNKARQALEQKDTKAVSALCKTAYQHVLEAEKSCR